jgi:4-hydroxymandelate oxidase
MTGEPSGGFVTLSDVEEVAAKKVSAPAWAYVQGGAGEERTLRANREAFQRRTLRPHVLVDVTTLDLTTTLLNEKVSAPFYVSAAASQGILHPEAEAGTARAASAANIIAMFSTLSTISLEQIAHAAPKGPRWFQLYLQPDFAVTRKLVERAEKAGFTALVLTVDMPVQAARDRQSIAGYSLEGRTIGNGEDVVPPSRSPVPDGQRFSVRNDASATWEILDRLQKITRLPVVVKGILTGEDARLAVDHGAKAVVVSNHGGRQLDGAPASLDALPEVVEAVGSNVEVYLDGGVRRGSDILIALALGAKAVGIGRPVLWALAAGGELGVAKLISLLKTDLATVMALTGRRTISEVDRTLVGA